MAKVAMKRMEIIALLTDSKSIIERLQRRESMEIIRFDSGESGLEPFQTMQSVTLFEKNCGVIKQAHEILQSYAAHKTGLLDSFAPRKELSKEEFSQKATQVDASLRTANDIVHWSQKITEDQNTIKMKQQQRDSLQTWGDMSIPLRFSGTATTTAFIGTLPGEWTQEKVFQTLLERMAGDGDQPVDVQLVFSSREHSGVIVICHNAVKADCEQALRSMNFAQPSLQTEQLPRDAMEALQRDIVQLKQDIASNEKAIAEQADKRELMIFAMDYLLMREDKYRALEDMAVSRNTIVIDGYVRADKVDALVEELESKYTLSIVVREPAEDEDVPVTFKNNSFVEGVEDLTEDYSMPAKGDIDPNPVMAAFYYILFGLMFSDAGYGLIMVIVTGLILRLKKPEGNTRRNMIKFFYCGLSTVFWGAMFGSWFGNAFATITGTFFGKEIVLAPIWFDPVPEPIKLLGFSLAVGFVQVMVGLIVKFTILWRSGDKLDALMDIGLWWVVFLGLGFILLNMLVSMPILNTIGLYTALAGGIGLVLTQGRSASNIVMKLVGGIVSLYNITGYFSDILSYCRLMALGLVTGIIGSVVNTIGSMSGPGVGGTIIFIIVFIFGHAINFAINVLGAYVHCNRLQYVEFFGKFYDGGGRPFRPLKVNTKHYKFREETTNV